MRKSKEDERSRGMLVSFEQPNVTPCGRSSVQCDMISDNSSRSGNDCLEPSVQGNHHETKANHQVKANTDNNTTFQSYLGSDEMKVPPKNESDAIRGEECRERLYREWLELAQATHQWKSKTYSSNTMILSPQSRREMKNPAIHQSDTMRREEQGRERAYQEKMKRVQAHPSQLVEGSSTVPLTLAPGAESFNKIPDAGLTDKKMHAFAIRDPSRLPPRPTIALSLAKREDWSSSLDFPAGKANLKSDPDEDVHVATRVSAENKKVQQGLTLCAPVMLPSKQREFLCMAPARAESIDTKAMLSRNEAVQRPGQGLEYSDQGLLEEKRRAIEGSIRRNNAVNPLIGGRWLNLVASATRYQRKYKSTPITIEQEGLKI